MAVLDAGDAVDPKSRLVAMTSARTTSGRQAFMSRAFANQAIHMAFAKDLSSPIDTPPQGMKKIRSGTKRSRRPAAK